MEENPSSEAYSYSAGQDITNILRNPKFHFHAQQNSVTFKSLAQHPLGIQRESLSVVQAFTLLTSFLPQVLLSCLVSYRTIRRGRSLMPSTTNNRCCYARMLFRGWVSPCTATMI
jgi:hypothetical protein